MGKRNKINNQSNEDKKEFRKKRKDDQKNRSLGIQSKPNHKNLKAPDLKYQKQRILYDMEKKKTNSSREDLIQSLKDKLEKGNVGEHNNYLSYKIDADSKHMLYDNENDTNIYQEDDQKKANVENRDFSRKAYIKDLKQVIENSDVILEVLDSRDPLSCKSLELEELIRGHKDAKKIILILNKIDLVPTSNAIQWQQYFYETFKLPSVIFKANTQNQSSNLSSANIYKKSFIQQKDFIDEVLSSNKSLGADKLLELLKNYCRVEGGGKRKITVGVVGFPNVGKSSIINSLKRGKVVGVSNTPGFTKGMQEIILDRDIKLLDCPGVVLSNNAEDAILRNVIRIEDIKDPVEVISLILNKVGKSTLVEVYDLKEAQWETTERLLYLIGDKLGKYKKGGLIDFDKVARIIIRDWNDGKLKYFTVPPNVNSDLNEVEMK